MDDRPAAHPTTPGKPHLPPRLVGLGVLVSLVLAVTAVLVPAHGDVALATAEWLGAAAVAARLLLRGPVRSRVGWGLVALLAALGASSTALVVVGPGAPLALGLIVLGQGVGLAAIARPLLRHRPSAVSAGGALISGAVLSGTELAILLTGTSLAIAQAASAALAADGLVLSAVTASVDVLALALITWLALTRSGAVASARLIHTGLALFLLQNLLASTGGQLLGSERETFQVLGVVAACTTAAAGLHRALVALEPTAAPPALRRGSTRILVVIPFALVPALVWLVAAARPEAALPGWVVTGSALLVTVLALVRALRLVSEAERAADTDPLTGVLGRRGALRVLEDRLGAARGTWVCLLDLDDFKSVNDRFGHDRGDQLLRAVTDRLAAVLPPATPVARLGGDELVVLLDREGHPDPDVVGALLMEAFEARFALDDVRLDVTASIGVAASHDPVEPDAGSDARRAPRGRGPAAAVELVTPESALARADVAMAAAKRRGGAACVTYGPLLREEVHGPRQVQRELRALLAGTGEDVGDLVVVYQPVVALPGGEPRGVEALVRWQHPVRGFVPPDSFLPLAETAGLGALIDHRVLQQALHQVAAWDALGLVGLERVGINLGSSTMRSPTLRADVLAACAAAGVCPSRLLLEITEHDEVEDEPGVVADLIALRATGASVALDDFGAGYSSVGYLRRWPADVVKLDRSLLPSVRSGHHGEDADRDADGALLDAGALLTAVGAFATSLGRDLVAEGLETPDDVAAALAAGAAEGQGYLFGRPMAPGDLAVWWRERTQGSGGSGSGVAVRARDPSGALSVPATAVGESG